METQIKTVVCPNCGANATNLQNCEYCGSMLVRCCDMIENKTDEIAELLDEIRNKTYVSPLLQKQVGKAIQLSKKHNTKITTSFFFCHTREWQHNVDITISPSGEMAQLTIIFNMNSPHEEQMYEEAFSTKPFSKLFTHKQILTQMLCSMDIDKNERVIASFVKYILNKIFLERGDNRVNWKIRGVVNGRRVEFVPNTTMVDINHYRRSNMIRRIVAIVLTIIPFFLFIFSFWWGVVFLLFVTWPVWGWAKRNYVKQYMERARNAEIIYNVYDESLVSENDYL